jgi:FtsH-binding integral membrane protein
MNETNTSSSTNKHSITSLVFGILTLASLCTASLPLPFTAILCLPIGFIFSLVALIYGGIALSQIRKNKEAGSPMAWVGILSGGLMLLCILCMIVALVSLFVFAPDSVPPFLRNYQI